MFVSAIPVEVVEEVALMRATVEEIEMMVVRGSSSPASMGIGILDEDARIQLANSMALICASNAQSSDNPLSAHNKLLWSIRLLAALARFEPPWVIRTLMSLTELDTHLKLEALAETNARVKAKQNKKRTEERAKEAARKQRAATRNLHKNSRKRHQQRHTQKPCEEKSDDDNNDDDEDDDDGGSSSVLEDTQASSPSSPSSPPSPSPLHFSVISITFQG